MKQKGSDKMPVSIKWFPPSWFQIKTKDKIIYIDPAWMRTYFTKYPKKIEFSKWPDPIDGLPEKDLEKANVILLTHHHKDHCKGVTVNRLKDADTLVVAPKRCSKELGKDIKVVEPGDEIPFGDIKIKAVDAYNTEQGSSTRKVHHKGDCVGYLITLGDRTIYHAGDTDFIPEMSGFGDVEVALLPIGGTFTMDIQEAVDAAIAIKRLSHNSIIKPLFDIFICFQLHINIMAFIKRLRNQNWLFPPTIADLIEEDHICRLVDDVVESIDFESIEEKYDGPGSPAYHPKVMMKLLIQGTIDGIRSSRKISKATKENVVYMYLSDHLNPDFRTICRFRKDKLETIKLVIAEIAKLAREMGMVKLGHLSIDGTKIKASASNFSVVSKEELDEIKEAIDMELQKGIEIDEMEDHIYGDTDPDKLPKSFKDIKEKIRKDKAAKIIDQYKNGDQKEKKRIEKQLGKAQNELEASGKDFVSFTDPESRFMKNKKHFSEFSYNPQVTVDAEHGIVVAEDVVQNVRDVEQLKPQIEQIEEVFGKLPKNTIISADNDYHSAGNIDFLKEHELDGYIPHEKLASKMQGKTKESGRFDKDNFKYNVEKDDFTCPNGETVIFGFEYFDKQKGKQVRVYRGTGCAQCPDKKLCTKSKRGPRRIKCYGNEANLREMAEKMESPEGQEVYRVRAKTVERPFGHIKQNIGLREFLARGVQGVRAEFSLACIAHNLKRIWTIKSQTKAIGVNPTKNGRIDHSSLKNMCRSIKGVWSQILSSFSKGLSIYQL